MRIVKVIARIFLILAAALMVVGATLALSHTGLARNLGTVGAIVLVYVAISLAFSGLKGWFKRNRSSLRSAAL
jgi:hypothetical protein